MVNILHLPLNHDGQGAFIFCGVKKLHGYSEMHLIRFAVKPANVEKLAIIDERAVCAVLSATACCPAI